MNLAPRMHTTHASARELAHYLPPTVLPSGPSENESARDLAQTLALSTPEVTLSPTLARTGEIDREAEPERERARQESAATREEPFPFHVHTSSPTVLTTSSRSGHPRHAVATPFAVTASSHTTLTSPPHQAIAIVASSLPCRSHGERRCLVKIRSAPSHCAPCYRAIPPSAVTSHSPSTPLQQGMPL
jgi:hypothetical protein